MTDKARPLEQSEDKSVNFNLSDIFSNSKMPEANAEKDKIAQKESSNDSSKDSSKDALPKLEIIGAEKKFEKLEVSEKPRFAPATSPNDLASIGKSVLKKVDKDADGYITKTELAKAMENPNIKGQEAQVLSAIYKNFDKLHNLSNHEYFYSKASITAEDLDKFHEKVTTREANLNDAMSMLGWAQKGVAKFAADGETLTANDIAKALNNKSTSAEDKAALLKVQKHFDNIAQRYGLPLIGTTGARLEDFNTFTDKHWANSDDAKLIRSVSDVMQRTRFEGQNPAHSRELYAKGLESIRPEAIKQGMIGNCYFESALAAVAAANPQAIKDAIKDNKDGTYTVTFPGAPDEPITIKAPTEAEMGIYNGGSEHGTWAAVMEKAYGKYRDNHAWVGSYTPQEGADGGGRPEPVLKLLTGKDAEWNWVGSDQSKVAHALDAAINGKSPKAVTAGINSDAPIWDLLGYSTKQTDDKFYKGHEYTITAFKPDGKGGGTVTIRNPWGGANGTTSGTIDIPLSKFMKNFSTYSIQSR